MSDVSAADDDKNHGHNVSIEGDEVKMSESKPAQAPVRDTKFYIEPVTFKVGNTIFKVAKSGFMVAGTIFEAMFALPIDAAAGSLEGLSDEHPIHLSGVDEKKFRAFLTIMYPSRGDANIEPESWYNILVGALDLATMWDFADLRKDIISRLSPIIVNRNKQEFAYVAKRYQVADWLHIAYRKLVDPSSELPLTELMSSPHLLNWETMTKIYFIRETLLRVSTSRGGYCQSCGKTYGSSGYSSTRYGCECHISALIDTEFEKEFESMAEIMMEPPV